MNDYQKNRVDETRMAYLEALARLKNNCPNNVKLKGKLFKINAATIALESGKSRNPLYHTHKDILDMIHDVKTENKDLKAESKEVGKIAKLEARIKELEEQNKKLLNVNATLLFNSKIKSL